MDTRIFRGCIPAIMTPCHKDRTPNYAALVETAQDLMQKGMDGVVYCGSMGEWPLLSDSQRQEGVRQLAQAGIPVIVGTGAISPKLAAEHAAHGQSVGAKGLMVIPRLLSRGTSSAAQKNHFETVLSAAPELPAVIYNSPYYGYETKADLFFELRRGFKNLVGFKEFGGASSLSYAAEFITNASEDILLLAGVDTTVYHGFVHCGADGAITGIGNCLPEPILKLVSLCKQAQSGNTQARRYAQELDEALSVLSKFDEGPDLVLYYKYYMVLAGHDAYELPLEEGDALSPSQKAFARTQWELFQAWWADWAGKA
ncbi:4-hydroxy-tetrahydrodipicolinate synthase [Novipirellula aureliae]|uniref:4-hydroxy-tetrahydrodipicolinate synthase n=1 Tax=Novipirellula aureliae TaxID=2527966 RepID=A0A5C6DNP8_9BACT|nr:dihydrodipicolinate synthase family protein [Novipirellula aureliae]TWU37824.1 4-hydroxy-tetrahydrodipicolinate synthase [Novipirellula aureliae]